MKHVHIKSISRETKWGDLREEVEIYIDGVSIGRQSYGGEPEDNTRGRDYAWVEVVIEEIARELGATVTTESVNELGGDREY